MNCCDIGLDENLDLEIMEVENNNHKILIYSDYINKGIESRNENKLLQSIYYFNKAIKIFPFETEALNHQGINKNFIKNDNNDNNFKLYIYNYNKILRRYF
jgi:hypothetical protein